MVLEENKIEAILVNLKYWWGCNKGIPFLDFHKIVSKVQHASKDIHATVKALFMEINYVIILEPRVVFI